MCAGAITYFSLPERGKSADIIRFRHSCLASAGAHAPAFDRPDIARGGRSLPQALRLGLQMCLSLPHADLQQYPKPLAASCEFLELVTRVHMPLVRSRAHSYYVFSSQVLQQ